MAFSTQDSVEIHYFKEILNKIGITLEYSDNPNVFQREQSLIIRDVQKELEKHPNFPNNISEFTAGVKHLIKKQKLFKKALLPSQLHQITDDIVGVQQESLFRLMLNVDCIQTQIIAVLLEEVTYHAVNAEEDTIWLRLLLGPFRYLSYLKSPKELAVQLLEILEVATYPAQLEILNFIPDIIPDSEYDETAKQLTKVLNQSSNLTRAIINCLNYLNLNADTKMDIQDHILAILNSTLDLKTFCLIFSFVVSDCKSSNLSNILMKTRNALDTIMVTQNNNKDTESDQVLTFEEIRSVTISSKHISEGWINLINNIRNSNDHKSVDVIILLMLHSSGSNRKHLVESIFKKKIKNLQFKSTLIETTLQKYLAPQLLKEYITSIQEISAFLLRLHNEPLYLQFAQVFYTVTFSHKYADKQQRQQILSSLILLTGSSDGKKSIPALSILEMIAEQNIELLQPHTMQLMILLDKIEVTNLSEVKQMFDLLCSLIYGPKANESMNVFQNDIQILVRKQLSSLNKSVKYRGIIAAVATAKNIGTTLEENDSSALSNDSYASISDLPQGPAQQAASLLEMTNQSTLNCAIARGLYFDQLAQMVVTTEHLDKHFMAWLFDTITLNFQEIYLTEVPPEPINDIPITIQYNLNSIEETESPIAVNLTELTIHSVENNNLMLVFAPLFRLLRLMHFRQHEGNLSTIDALLGCGISMPEVDPDLGIESYDTEQSSQVIDCLFHCINWFREIISAFVTQKDMKLRQKLLERLKQLVELEELFSNSMKLLPDHRLPPSYFYNLNLDSSSSSVQLDHTKPISEKGKRKRSTTTTQNITRSVSQTTSQAVPSTSTSKSGRKTAQNKEKDCPDFQFREMDTDIIILLKHPLVTQDATEPENSLFLTLAQYKFIIKDLVSKLNAITKHVSHTSLTHLVTVKPENLILDCLQLMPHINKHLLTITEEIKNMLRNSDGIHDAHEMFLSPATELKLCFGLTLELQSLVLNWSGFQNNKNLPLLRKYLRACVGSEFAQLHSAQQLITEYIKCVMSLTEQCLTLSTAVHLINIVKALCNDGTAKRKLILLSGKLLSTRWFNLNGLPETGSVANLHIDALVKAHLQGSTVETISSVVSWIHVESATLKSKDDNLATFPSITKANFPILYRGVCSALLDSAQQLQGLTNSEHLQVWLTITVTLKNLMNIVKVQENRTNLGVFLKKALAILKVFLSQGLPILEIMLKSNSDTVVEILRTLQQTTRFIHNLCCHSKITKNSALIAYVPYMRLTLETLVYRVKATLVANNCSSAFWMGNLRNKDLHGEEILSQSSTNSSNIEPNEDDEEELPADDDSDDDALTTGTENSSEII